MPTLDDIKVHRAYLYLSLFGFALLGLGFVAFLRFVPPLAPWHTAPEVAHHFLSHPNLRRVGVVLLLAGSVFALPWGLVLLDYFRRIEGGRTPLSNLYVLVYAISTIATWICGFLWAALAFRPDQDPATMQALNDVSWYVATFPVFALLQWLVMGLLVFRDRDQAYFPRWLGWLSMWVAFTCIGGTLVIFFKDGAFGWNGVFGFYAPNVIGLPWIVGVILFLFKGLKKDEAALSAEAVERELVHA